MYIYRKSIVTVARISKSCVPVRCVYVVWPVEDVGIGVELPIIPEVDGYISMYQYVGRY